MAEKRIKWTMPKHLEKYRSLIVNTGGNPIEELMNDTTTNMFNNSIRTGIIVMVRSQISLLEILHQKELLK